MESAGATVRADSVGSAEVTVQATLSPTDTSAAKCLLLRARRLKLPPDELPPKIPRIPRRAATLVDVGGGVCTLLIDPMGAGNPPSLPVNFVFVDTTGDGLTDALIADTDGDGYGDSLVFDTTGDGMPDMAVAGLLGDTTGDGQADILLVDTTDDGVRCNRQKDRIG